MPSLLTSVQLDRALDIAAVIADHHLRAKALADLAPHLNVRQLMRALQIANEITNRWSQLAAMIHIGPCLPQPARKQIVIFTIALAASIQREGELSMVVEELAPLGPDPSDYSDILARAVSAGQEGAVLMTAKKLIPHLPASELDDILRSAHHLPENEARAALLARLAERLSGAAKAEALDGALRAATAIGNEVSRITALAGVARCLQGPARTRVVDQALDTVAHIAEWSTLSLPDLVPLMDSAQLDRLLELAARTRNESSRAHLLRAVAPCLDAAQLGRALPIALALPNQLGDDPRLSYHEIGGSVCVAMYTRLGALADSTAPGDTINLLRRLYDALPPRSLLLTVTGVTAPAVARAAGPESVARQFDTLVER